MDCLITNPNQKLFIRLNKDGTPETCARHEAQKFESSKAKNIVNHLPKTFRKFNFKVEVIPEIASPMDKEVLQEIKKNIKNADCELSESTISWLDKFGKCSDTFNEAKERLAFLLQELENSDNQMVDILHKIELESPKDLYHGWLLYKEIKANRKNRRFIKDEIIIIQNVLEKVNSSHFSRERVQKAIDGLFKRKYRFRIVEDIEESEENQDVL